MVRMARVTVFAADKIAIVHGMDLAVWRCFLLGDDRVTGKKHDHRRQWLGEQLGHKAKFFGIDLLCQAALPDHLHVALRGNKAACPAEIALGFKNDTGIAGAIHLIAIVSRKALAADVFLVFLLTRS